MSDASADRRAPPPPRISTTAAYSYTAGMVIATFHFIGKCYHVDTGVMPHHVFFSWTLPDDSLIEMWVFMMLPTLHLIGRIINNHLRKLAGDAPDAA